MAIEQQKKKDKEKKRIHEKRAAHDALERHHRAQEREGLPLEASPSTIDGGSGDDDEGMEVWLGFNPEASSAGALSQPSGGQALVAAEPEVEVLAPERAASVPRPMEPVLTEVVTDPSAEVGGATEGPVILPIPHASEAEVATQRATDQLPAPSGGPRV